ncbi:hypothetical protein GCM10011415_10530 [Salipiger pallidus]|uniref:DUF927 domain-containing protein n=1 Tax=Salipiger pallidus TaxID=1775170 RepID=A0A8J3EG79_9RHOB|nr:DUF927 domain-containing protein [Salipiger pallidus]GGG65643.1 hypothetical protein GCM10011415_10530 [Salipiger pallidus]
MTDQSNTITLHAERLEMPSEALGPATPETDSDLSQPERIPDGFMLREDGIYEMRGNEDTDEIAVRICSPVIVHGLTRKANGSGWAKIVSVQDPDGEWHEVLIEKLNDGGTSLAPLAPMRDFGFEPAEVDKVAKSIRKLLKEWKPRKRITRVERLGWVDDQHDTFVLGAGRAIGKSEVFLEGVSGEVQHTRRARGSLEEWRDKIGLACIGNPLMMLSVSHAFSGPLLSILGSDGGGFHLRGASSRGKSTLLGVAASVWGAPEFVQSWRGTDNGFEVVAAASNDTLLVLDELHQVDPKLAGNIAYDLANGRGKSRMTSGGAQRNTLRWQVPILSSGEISLEEHMKTANRAIYAGQEVRLIDIEATGQRYGAFDELHEFENGRAFADGLKQRVGEANGVAGRRFVERLVKTVTNGGDVKRNIDSTVAKFLRHWSTALGILPEGQVQRVMKRFAIAAVAGELATGYDITGWQPGQAHKAALGVLEKWFEGRDAATGAEVAAHLEQLSAFIRAAPSRFATEPGAISEVQAGWRIDGFYHVRPEWWHQIFNDGEAQDAARALQDVGYLDASTPGSLQKRLGRKFPSRPRVYAVREEALVPYLG